MIHTKRITSALAAAAVLTSSLTGIASAQSMDELVAAATKEGQLTTIALPHDWCGYGGVIEGFKAKYPGITVNELNPDAGSADEIEAIKANKDNKGPQAPDVIDVGLAFGPTSKAEGLTQPYKVSTWAEIPDTIKDADGFWYGDYYGVMSFMVNKDLVKTMPADWADLLKPEYKGEVQMANPASSGTAYTVIATLVQIMGEDKAFDYLKSLHKNISTYTRSGTAPIKAAARGETMVSISFVHDVTTEAIQGFPVGSATPSEGTGAEIGSMSIIKGARNLEQAKKFYEWALTPGAQQFGVAAKQFQLPSNMNTAIDPRMPDPKKIKLINYDYAKYGSSAERRRLIAKWEKEINSLPR